MVFNPHAKATDADWERLQRLDHITYSRAKSSVEEKKRTRELKEGIGQEKVFEERELLEIAGRSAELEERKTGEWAKVGIRRL
jgi:hypothetical protein